MKYSTAFLLYTHIVRDVCQGLVAEHSRRGRVRVERELPDMLLPGHQAAVVVLRRAQEKVGRAVREHVGRAEDRAGAEGSGILGDQVEQEGEFGPDYAAVLVHCLIPL